MKYLILIILSLSLAHHANAASPMKKNQTKDMKIYERYIDNTADDQDFTKAQDKMVLIQPDGMRPFYIDQFEATISKRKAWSVPGLQPTTKLYYQAAKDACRANGKRICMVSEWRAACRGGSSKPFRFPNPEKLIKICDFARSAGYDKNDYVNKNNSHPKCTIPKVNIHHMMGNVVEFAESKNGQVTVLGLAYYDQHIKNRSSYMASACEITVHQPGAYPAGRHNEGLGFRCCRTAQ